MVDEPLCPLRQGKVPEAEAGRWARRTQQLIARLAASAPQLRSLEHWYPNAAPEDPWSALPPELGRLSQLTSLTLGFGAANVRTLQVGIGEQGIGCNPRGFISGNLD